MRHINGHTLSAAYECLRLAEVYRCDYCPTDMACGLFGTTFDDSRDECHHTLDLDAAQAILLLRDAVPEMLEHRRENERLRAALDIIHARVCMNPNSPLMECPDEYGLAKRDTHWCSSCIARSALRGGDA